MVHQNGAFHSKTDLSGEHRLLNAIRLALFSDLPFLIPKGFDLPFDPAISQIYVSLFQNGLKPIRWGARRATLETTLQRILEKLKTNPAISNFAVQDTNQCRILFEMVTEERPCELKKLTGSAFCDSRFEPGITGIKYEFQGVLRYFMPTDAVVHSIMSVSQLLRFLAKKTGIAKQSNQFSVREELMRSELIQSSLITSIAFISYTDQEVLPLYRGYPISKVRFDKETLLESTLKSIDWLVANMNDDGSFLYFYDAYQDTKVDFDHPNMTDPLYNNILRHCGGTITLLRGYELTERNEYLEAAGHSIQYLLSTIREHEWQGQYACYPFDNKKSKLGGAGVALVALMHYYRHTGNETYRKTIDGLVRHILSRIADDGEMIGYYIHPLFNQGQPIIAPSDDVKKQLFSFYYPGEALLGLALYYQWIERIDHDLKTEIAEKSEKALDFLVDIRPIKYKELFLELPADAWLMQAIEEWIKVDGFDKQKYIDFVFNDAEAMIAHSYHGDNVPYDDYDGGFYYCYGDHVYHDGSRCEGLAAAYGLAVHLRDATKAETIMAQMLRSSKGLMHTRNTPESTYSYIYPEKSLYAFRFKLTRQWVRVDSVQHTACFFARLIKFIENNTNESYKQSSPPLMINNPNSTMSNAINYLKNFDANQIFRFFVDGRYHKKYQGWIGYEAGEPGSVQALLNGLSFMLDHFDLRSGLNSCYLLDLHKVCMMGVRTKNPKSSPGELRYLNSGMPFLPKTTTLENVREVLAMRRNDGTTVFNTAAYAKTAEKLDAEDVYRAIQELGKLNYRNWYPNLNEDEKRALDKKSGLMAFYEIKHRIQMQFAQKTEDIVERYNRQIKAAETQEMRLRTIALLIRELELLHPFPDGNCRTFACVLLNQLLLNYGFMPAILKNPNLDGEYSLDQWIDEIKTGMETTQILLKNPRARVYDYSIDDATPEDKTRFFEMASELVKKKQAFECPEKTDAIFLTPRRLQAYTQGQWLTAYPEDLQFTGVGTYNTYSKGNVYFVCELEKWQKEGKEIRNMLAPILSKGIKALVIDDAAYSSDWQIPVLLVDNIFAALKAAAIQTRLELNPLTILITGTEGKTGAKIQLHHLLNFQIQAHGVLNSANTEIPVLRSLLNLKPNDRLEINEVSVGSNEALRIERAQIVNPDICLLTNIGPNHMDMHKTMDNVLRAKSSVVEGLREGGLCIVNRDNAYYEGLVSAILSRKPQTKIVTYGSSESDAGQLIASRFDNSRLGWRVQARIDDEELDYFLPLPQSHAPLASIGVLLTVKRAGFDVKKVAADYASLKPFETMGCLRRLIKNEGEVLFYDQSRRGGISGMRSAFADIANIQFSGKLVALVGGISVLHDTEWTQKAHQELAELINQRRIDRLYTTGNYMHYVTEHLHRPPVKHSDDVDELAVWLLNDIKPGDLLFIIGSAYLYLGRVSDRIQQLLQSGTETIEATLYKITAPDYRMLCVYRDITKGTKAVLACASHAVHYDTYRESLKRHPSFTDYRASMLVDFFENLNGLLSEVKSMACVNDIISATDFKRYVVTWEFCRRWFNNIDKNSQLPNKNFLGSFFEFGHSELLLHVGVGTFNIHIGFIHCPHSDGSYLPCAMSEENGKRFLSELTAKGINDLHYRSWGPKWLSMDLGRFIEPDKPDIFIAMTETGQSELFNRQIHPLLQSLS